MSKTSITRRDLELSIAEQTKLQQVVSFQKYQDTDLGEGSFIEVKQRICKQLQKHAPEKLLKAVAEDAFVIDLVEEAIMDNRILPAGSILSIWGTQKVGSLSNCYLTPINSDSIEEIYDTLKWLARTFSYRGGSGCDISVLRPKGAKVNNAASASSGSVSFMPLFSENTNTIGQEGRRAALLLSEDIRHPDILDFIWCKADPEKTFGKDPLTGRIPDVTGANNSVKLTGEFMEAVQNEEDWTFRFPYRDKVTLIIDRVEHGLDAIAPIEVLRALSPKAGDTIHLVEDGQYQELIVDWVEWDHGRIALRDSGQDNSVKLGQQVCAYYPVGVVTPTTVLYDTLWNGDYDRWETALNQVCEPYDTRSAKDILWEIAEAAHAIGDPGVAYMDTVQKFAPGTFIDPDRLRPVGFNPCGMH